MPGRWHTLAERVLEGQPLGREQGLEILRSDDEELLDVLAAAYRVGGASSATGST